MKTYTIKPLRILGPATWNVPEDQKIPLSCNIVVKKKDNCPRMASGFCRDVFTKLCDYSIL